MRGEIKLGLYMCALLVASLFNIIVDRAIGYHPGIFSGTMLGLLLARLWPGIVFRTGDQS